MADGRRIRIFVSDVQVYHKTEPGPCEPTIWPNSAKPTSAHLMDEIETTFAKPQ